MKLKNSYLLVSTLTLSLFLNACAFKKDDGSDESASPKEVIQETIKDGRAKEIEDERLNKENVKVTFHERDGEFGLYDMLIKWPKHIQQVDIIINNSVLERAYRESEYRRTVKSGEAFQIELNSYGSFSAGLVSSIRLQEFSPRDELIREEQHLAHDTIWIADRVIFYENAHLYTNGFNLTIKAKKLILLGDRKTRVPMAPQEATIITTLPGFKIKNIEQTKNSAILLEAEQAIGNLSLALIGFDGKNGPDGQANVADTNQLNGRKGIDAIIAKDVVSCPSSKMDRPCERTKLSCGTHPTNGEDGKPGINGNAGADGQDGGDTGMLVFNIKDSSKLNVEVAQKAGKPGLPGKGSPGTAGGIGGAAGDHKQLCSPAQAGKNGQPGENGKDGKPGQPGKKTEIKKTVQQLHVYDI